jgi:hypothetical protein
MVFIYKIMNEEHEVMNEWSNTDDSTRTQKYLHFKYVSCNGRKIKYPRLLLVRAYAEAGEFGGPFCVFKGFC